MTLFTVERQGAGRVVIEASSAVAVDGWWMFLGEDGRTLATLAIGEVLSIQATPQPATGAERRDYPCI